MILRRPDPKVLLVPGGLILEFFVLARFAAHSGCPALASKVLRALRAIRPDISELSAYLALSLVDLGEPLAALEVLRDYLHSDFDESSLIYAIYARLQFDSNDPDWAGTAKKALECCGTDGGGATQTALLSSLPSFEYIDGRSQPSLV